MNKFITFTLVLLGLFASGHCRNYGAGPAVQQVSLSSLPNIQRYLDGASSAYGPTPISNGPASISYSGAGGYGGPGPDVAGYGAPVALAPATSVVAPSAHSYSAGGPGGYAGPAAGPASYGAAPRLTVQPAYATQLYPGQQNYKAFVSPTTHDTVALPILPATPVAKLFVPNQQQSSYAGPASSGY